MSNINLLQKFSNMIDLLSKIENTKTEQKEHFISQLEIDKKELEGFYKIVQIKKEVQTNKKMLTEKTKSQIELMKKRQSIRKNIRDKYDQLKLKEKTSLFNPEGNHIGPHRVLEHHSIVLPFISVPKDYRVSDSFLPWSFGTNKPEISEIENSNLNYKYKQNRNYKKLGVPSVKYMNGSDKNISKLENTGVLSVLLEVNGSLYIQATIEQKEDIGNQLKSTVHFTKDGSDPTRHNFLNESPEMIFIQSSCVLKLRTFKPGWIESDMLTMEIKIVSQNEDSNNFNMENMVRPNFAFSGESGGEVDSRLSDMNDGIFDNDNFASWHDYGTYSTPKDN